MIILAAMVCLIGAGALVLWHEHEALPSIEDVRALARQRQFAQAQVLLTRYLRVFPSDNRAHLLMAQVAMDRPDPQPDCALEHLHKVKADTPKDAAILRLFEGKAYYQQKRYDLAESFWKQALDLDPSNPSTQFDYALALRHAGRYDESIVAWQRVLLKQPDLPGRTISSDTTILRRAAMRKP